MQFVLQGLVTTRTLAVGSRLVDGPTVAHHDGSILAKQVERVADFIGVRSSPQEDDPIGVLEHLLRIGPNSEAGEQGKAAVRQLHGTGVETFHCFRQLQEAKGDVLLGPEHATRGDSKDE